MAKSKPLKIIIDTNLWISFIISKRLQGLDAHILSGNVRILFSEELIQELSRTIEKPHLKRFFGDNALYEMMNAFDPYIDFVKIQSKVSVCRDSKDDFLLALAKDGQADYLITGDKDLLSLIRFKKTKITTVALFMKSLKN